MGTIQRPLWRLGKRYLAFWIARRRGGMALKELGKRARGMDYSAVSEAIRYFERHQMIKSEVRHALETVMKFLNLEM